MDDSVWKVEPGHALGPLELGAERQAVLARAAAAGMEATVDDDDPTYALLPDMDTELWFGDESPHRLLEIVINDDRVRFGPLQVLGKRVHEIVELLQVSESETLWRTLAQDGAEGEGQALTSTAARLLNEETLWITTLGLGLPMRQGVIATVLLRQPHDAPTIGVGPFLPEHAELSRSPDLEEKLAPPWKRPHPGGWFVKLSALVLVLGLGIIICLAVRCQQRWNNAPVVEGVIVDARPPPPDPFPDEFTIAYQDQQGRQHKVEFDFANINRGRRVGDKVDVRYLPDHPDQAMGLNASHDAAVVTFLPWALGLLMVYAVVINYLLVKESKRSLGPPSVAGGNRPRLPI